MRLYEYEGKTLFRAMGIPLPEGVVVKTVPEAKVAAERIGYPVVVKAQVLRGGRGKAGLVKVAQSAEELAALAAGILERIGPDEKLLIESAFPADAEAYVGITVDDLKGCPVMVISAEGGIHVEEATASGSRMARLPIRPREGVRRYEILNAVKSAGFTGKIAVGLSDLAVRLYQTFRQYDCDTAEINPVMINTADKLLVAGDAKVVIDAYAYDRQPAVQEFRAERNLVESRNVFVDLGGNIALVSGGASGTMMVCDSIKVMGGEPANFIDTPGGNSHESVLEKCQMIFKMVKEDPRYKVILFNFSLSASPIKTMADAVAQAVDEDPPAVPMVVSARATGAALNPMSLEEAGAVFGSRGIIVSPTLQDAIKTVIEIAGSGSEGGAAK